MGHQQCNSNDLFQNLQRLEKHGLATGKSSEDRDRFHSFSTFSILPSGYVNIAIENGHRNRGFTHEHVDFRYVSLPEGSASSANPRLLRRDKFTIARRSCYLVLLGRRE